MDIKDFRGLVEAYSEVYAPQEELDEGYRHFPHDKVQAKAAKLKSYSQQNVPVKGKSDKEIDDLNAKQEKAGQRATTLSLASRTSHSGIPTRKEKANKNRPESEKRSKTVQSQKSFPNRLRRNDGQGISDSYDYKEDFDIFDIILEFLQVEGYAETLEEAEWLMANELDSEDIEAILEAEGSYGETPKAYSAALKTKMTAKRKPFLKAMQRRTNPANRKDAYASPRKGMTASDREEARAGAAHGSPRGHDYPSQGPGGVTKSAKKLRKQKAMGEFAKEDFELWVNSLVEEGYDLSNYTWDEMRDIYEEEQLNELSNRKMRAYIKKSQQSHKEINKKWDQGTATEKEKLKSIGHEIGQERAYKKLDKRVGR